MAWYYSEGGKQVGPVEEAALDNLASQGVVRADTMVWQEGMPTWQPYSSVRGSQTGARRYAGFWIRFVAKLIDGILLAIVGGIIRLPLAAVMGISAVNMARSGDPNAVLAAAPAIFGMIGLSICINIALGVAYEVYFLSTRGATLGKMALGLKVITADGGPISAGLAAGRYFAQILSSLIFMIGYIIAGFDSEKRSLHDRICNTRVIYGK